MTTIKTILFILLIALCDNTNAQAPDWAWAKGIGSWGNDFAWGISNDINGNLYVIGSFDSPTITFGSTILTDTNTNWRDIFIVKYDASGNVLWAKRAGGINGDIPKGICSDANGNIYIIGCYNSPTIIFGSTTLTNTYADSSGGSYNMFIVKCDALGNMLWAKSIDLINANSGMSINASTNGGIYITACYNYPTITIDNTTLINADTSDWTDDFFITKYDESGNMLWAKSAGGTNNDRVNSSTLDASGNIYVTGSFYSPTLSIGSNTLTNTDTTYYTGDIFLAKYDANGNSLWAKSACGNKHDEAISISVDVNNYLYLTGGFQSSSITFESTSLTNIGYSNVFIAKYDCSGNLIWAEKAGGNSNDAGTSICTDIYGNAYIAGRFFSPTITFGDTTLTNDSAGWDNFFITKYDSSGNSIWAKSNDSPCYDYCTDMSIDANSNLYVTGIYWNTIIFNTDTFPNSGGNDFFIVKLICGGAIVDTTCKYDIVVYPNPSDGQFTIIKYGQQIIDKLEIYDLQGERIYNTNLNSNKVEINFSNRPKGFYLLKTTVNNENTTKKIIIE